MMKKRLQQGSITLFLILILSILSLGFVILRYIDRNDYKKQNHDAILRVIREESIHQSEPLHKQMTLFLGASDYQWRTQQIAMSLSEYKIDLISNLVKMVLEKNAISIPAGTKLRSVFWAEDNIVYIDLTEEMIQNHPGGTWAEMISIYSLVNTIIYNIKEVKGVKILVEGKEIRVLSGHVNTLYPLVFRKEP